LVNVFSAFLDRLLAGGDAGATLLDESGNLKTENGHSCPFSDGVLHN
jgi:hypothetical protein